MEKPLPLIVAEAGSHYASSNPYKRIEWAKYFADVAAVAGADYVKYQMFTEGELFCPVEGDDGRRIHWKNCYLGYKDWVEIRDYCRKVNIGFLVSAFQTETVEWAVALEPDYIKVASRAVRDFPYDMVRGFKLIISDGMYPLPHHSDGLKLQCVSKYPTPLEEARWSRHDGLSDHSGTPWPAIDALSRGAKIVEVHLYTEKSHRDRLSAVNRNGLSLICDARNAFARMQKGGRPKLGLRWMAGD